MRTTERSNILIIDDDVRLCRLIAEFFSGSDYDDPGSPQRCNGPGARAR
jgi:hypothetical protein